MRTVNVCIYIVEATYLTLFYHSNPWKINISSKEWEKIFRNQVWSNLMVEYVESEGKKRFFLLLSNLSKKYLNSDRSLYTMYVRHSEGSCSFFFSVFHITSLRLQFIQRNNYSSCHLAWPDPSQHTVPTSHSSFHSFFFLFFYFMSVHFMRVSVNLSTSTLSKTSIFWVMMVQNPPCTIVVHQLHALT